MTDVGIEWLKQADLAKAPKTTPILARTYRDFERYLREHPEIDAAGARFIGLPANLRGLRGQILHVLPGWDRGRPSGQALEFEQTAADYGIEWVEV